MKVFESRHDLRRALATRRDASIGLVPTMGYLHQGHASLMQAARETCDTVVATIFVNPTQFGPNEDLDTYPRDPEGDAATCRAAGVDYIWMPEVSGVYDPAHCTTVHVDGLTDTLCGASRPGHFDGVTTVVTKLLNTVQPSHAFFGNKDYQQLAVIRRMVRDLDMPVQIVGMPIVREPDGLAMSSRNAYLSVEERAAGLCLSRALTAARDAWAQGERDAGALRARALSALTRSPLVRPDYLTLVHPVTLVDYAEGPVGADGAVLAIAAFVGATRLIDNARVDSL